MLGGFLALLSAATFAFNNATVRRGVLTGTVLQGLAITVPIGVPIFLGVSVAAGGVGKVFGFSPAAFLALAGAGVIHFVWGRYCNFRATKAIGANLVAPVQQFSLILTLVLAVWILGESLTMLQLIGIVLVVLGPTLTLGQGATRTKKPADEPEGTPIDVETDGDPGRPAAFNPNYVEGYLFALLSSSGYGVSPILVRFGLANGGPGASLAGGLIAYAAATVVLTLIIVLLPGYFAHVRSVRPDAAEWFTISGVLVCVSQMFSYMALSIAPVSIVTPIARLSIVFRVYFSWWLTPDHEVFGAKLVLGTLVSMLGAIALSVSTELVLSVIPLPDALVALARWRWT